MSTRRSKRDPGGVKLQPADAFDLIRWLARSQSDPRKAVAELVQNAIDANARTIVIERRRRGRRPVLVVRDDGEGIRPHEERELTAFSCQESVRKFRHQIDIGTFSCQK